MTQEIKRDRLSIHIENGENEIREAVTILRNGGTAAQSGLVGVTNTTYLADTSCDEVFTPLTLLHVHATGDQVSRFSSGPSKSYRSSIELISNGQQRASGLHISYDPAVDDAYVDVDSGYGYYEPCVNPGVTDKTVADFSLIRPSGEDGMEFSHISLSERGYVSIGLTKVHEQRHFEANAPLTVAYICDGHQDSGTISMHEQGTAPTNHADYGKIYVKPYTVGGRSQAIFFKDDTGNETNLVLSTDLETSNSTDGLIYGNNGNTYGGWYSTQSRQADPDKSNNTLYGWGAGNLGNNVGIYSCNTLLGYHAGSGLDPLQGLVEDNTVIGCNSLSNHTLANDNVVIGSNSLTAGGEGPSSTIVIGNNIFNGSEPENGTIAIGQGSSPLVLGKFTGSNKYLGIQDGNLDIFSAELYTYRVSHEFESGPNRFKAIHSIVDETKVGVQLPESPVCFSFENSDGLSLNLFEIDPDEAEMTNTPNYANPTEDRPFARLDGDFKLRGAMRFQDGTSLSGLSEFELLQTFGTSGINKALETSTSANYFVLDYSALELAGNVSDNIRTDNTFVAVQLDGTASSNVGKMSLQGLADYVSSGTTSIAENCNVLISNPENELDVNTGANARSVMIGCDVAYGASGQNNSIMIGSEAGANAVVSNPGLAADWSNIFIGSSAGYDSQDTAYTIAIGNSAGKNSDSSTDAIFIGNSAGLNSTYTKSIGIGKHALEGSSANLEGGNGNIEIVAGLLNTQRLFHPSTIENPNLSDRLNIQNSIAGRTDRRNISIGDARLSPTAPLEVRRDSLIHADNGNTYIQTWYCDDVLVASLDCEGNFSSDGGGSFTIEGFVSDTDLQAAASMAVPTSGKLSIYNVGTATGNEVYITNRDSTLTINTGTYVVASKIGTEYRPTWVACS
ncbi:hypothetical protein OAK92_01800 [Crocinitomicaceae bacterium]|nr:hypothetical protein [Crocinitomicaceae bacterium]